MFQADIPTEALDTDLGATTSGHMFQVAARTMLGMLDRPEVRIDRATEALGLEHTVLPGRQGVLIYSTWQKICSS